MSSPPREGITWFDAIEPFQSHPMFANGFLQDVLQVFFEDYKTDDRARLCSAFRLPRFEVQPAAA